MQVKEGGVAKLLRLRAPHNNGSRGSNLPVISEGTLHCGIPLRLRDVFGSATLNRKFFTRIAPRIVIIGDFTAATFRSRLCDPRKRSHCGGGGTCHTPTKNPGDASGDGSCEFLRKQNICPRYVTRRTLCIEDTRNSASVSHACAIFWKRLRERRRRRASGIEVLGR